MYIIGRMDYLNTQRNDTKIIPIDNTTEQRPET